MTQVDVNNAVNAIVNQYTGQTISYYGTYPGECTVPVAYYVERITGHSPVPSMAAARADGWGVSFPAALAPYFTHEAFQSGKAYPKGTILMWNSPHIAIVLSSDGSNTVEVFEQNADPDGSPCGSKSRVVNNSYHTCTYALIPVVTEVPAAPMYTLQPFDPHEMVLTSNASIWDLTTPTANVAVGNYDNGYQFNAQGKALHQDGRSYYMPDVTVPHGFLDENCIDYLPPAPAPVTTTSLGSYIPTSVKPAQTYTLVTTVNTYDSAGYAATGVSPSGTFPAGSYYVYDHQNDLYLLNISNTAQKASCKWVNGKDNVVPPPPEPIPATPVITTLGEADEAWKATYKPFIPGANPVTPPIQYKIALTYTVLDLDNKRPNMDIHEGKYIDIYGTFTKDNITYYRPRRGDDTNFENWYAIPVFDATVGQAILTKLMPTPRVSTPPIFERIYEDEIKFMEIIPKWYRSVKERIKKG